MVLNEFYFPWWPLTNPAGTILSYEAGSFGWYFDLLSAPAGCSLKIFKPNSWSTATGKIAL